MVKFFYLGLLALVALASADISQELTQGDCHPEAHAEIIEGCKSACGNETGAGSCQLNGKPYCACAKPPKPDTHDKLYECMTLTDDVTFGDECRGRCPNDLTTYVCDQDQGVNGHKIMCVCSDKRIKPSQSNTNMRLGAELGDILSGLLDDLEEAIGTLADTLFSILSDLLKNGVKALFAVLRGVLDKVKGVIDVVGV